MSKIQQLPGRDTQAYNIMSLIAISGELPVNKINRLSGGGRYKDEIIKVLKSKKLIRVFYRDKLRGLRLTSKAKQLLLHGNELRFSFFLTGHSDTNEPRNEVPRRIRLHRIAETYITMQNADVAVYRDAKPYIFAPEGCDTNRINFPIFYNSREIKELGTTFVKIRGARAVGTLLTESGCFIVYNTGNSLMKWEYKSEMRTKALMEIVICQERFPLQYRPENISGLILGDDMETAYSLLTSTGGVKHNYFVLDGNYDHFYFLTNNFQGEVVLKILCNSEKTAELYRVLSEGLYPRNPGFTVENDAINENDEPVLFAYHCDLPRIKRFDTALSLQEKKGTLICFDFQFSVLRRFCGENVQFQTINFKKCERRLFNET